VYAAAAAAAAWPLLNVIGGIPLAQGLMFLGMPSARTTWKGRLSAQLQMRRRSFRFRNSECFSSWSHNALRLAASPQPSCRQRRRQYSKSFLNMMPEGPEVRALVDQFRGGIGQRLLGLTFVSGRYVNNGPPDGYSAFQASLSPTPSFPPPWLQNEAVDIITDWNCKGKFMYILLDNGNQSTAAAAAANVDYQRSIWITLGMTGRFLSQKALHELEAKQQPTHVRWYLELVCVDDSKSASLGKRTRIYYADVRSFGTLKFSTRRQALVEKLESLGPDMLTATCTADDFLHVVALQRNPEKNICKFLMDQGNIAGIGNYILAEGLYRANIDPFATLSELDTTMQRRLFAELQAVALESYQSQNSVTAPAPLEFEFQCYGQKVCKRRGSPVIKEPNGPHGRTIWYTEEQLFMPRHERDAVAAASPVATQQPVDSATHNVAASRPVAEGNESPRPNHGQDCLAASAMSPLSPPPPRATASRLPLNHPIHTKTPSNAAAAATPGNAKLAALLKSTTTDDTENSNAFVEEAPLLVEEFANQVVGGNDSSPGKNPFAVPLRGTSTAAAAPTLGNAKLAAILAMSKGGQAPPPNLEELAQVNRVETTAAPRIVDPAPLVAKLLSGVTETGWKESLSPLLESSPSFAKLAVFLDHEREQGEVVYPPTKEIFAALNLCPLDAVKVIIVGQDPYHGAGQGHGLAFSVRKSVRPPPSLLNIIKEVIDDVGIDEPRHGNLECWARQGVLLLNTVLTVREGQALSHANKGWEEVTDAIIRVASERHRGPDSCGLVFLLWGNAAAQKVGPAIDTNIHKAIQTSHPSPLGATKTKSPFLGSRCFSRTNKALIAMGHDPVDWSVE
jgi:uracil-DNA glycosylase